ncbi:MAG: thermonuclease family protein [Proteobacteria bacterium]|nr:thermonuclease family protein [Pseudomonadota bacterium]
MVNGLDKIPKPDQPHSNEPRRILSPGRLLLILLVISVAQYVNTGSVSWLTDSFRWIENTVTGVVNNPGASLEKAGEAIDDIARQAGAKVPGTKPPTYKNNEADISWSAPAYDLSGKVVKIADGDTLTIIDADRVKHKIRLYGIDTPEYDQAHYAAAKSALSLLVSNKAVGIDVKDTDSYGRTVGVVYIDGRNVNLQMVKSGHAWWYKRYAGLNQALREAEEHARAHQLGLWADTDPIAPWDWRRQRR